MQRVGLTGGIACGKSVVGTFLTAWGIPVCDADALAHETIRRDGVAYQQVIAIFGEQILSETGEIDRRKLGQRVFANSDERRRLESIIHPHVHRAWQEWADGLRAPVAVVMVPLLFEAALDQEWDAVVSVAAPLARRIQWLKQRGLSPDEIQSRFAAQLASREQIERSDVVLFNSGSKAVLEEQARRAWDVLAMPPGKGCV